MFVLELWSAVNDNLICHWIDAVPLDAAQETILNEPWNSRTVSNFSFDCSSSKLNFTCKPYVPVNT